MSLDKVDSQHHFIDLSDYARPVARILTRALVPTPVSPIHITLVYTLVGFVAAVLFATGSISNAAIAGFLLILKSLLDAIDGSLARARHQPSRVGRFLDSLCDYFVNAAVFLGIAIGSRPLSLEGIALAVLGLESATWQGTAFNYYYVIYRTLSGGDTTSKLDEKTEENYPWDNPATLRILLRLYRLIYGWQDALMDKIDRRITPDRAAAIYQDRRLLTAITVMGLGFQLLLIAACAWIGRADWVLWLFAGPVNLYWVIIIYVRYRASSSITFQAKGK